MPVVPPELARGWTLADLEGLPEGPHRYELVDGGLVVTPPPTQQHQELAYAVHAVLAAAAPTGWRVRVEYPVPFADDTQRVPDVVVFRWPLQHPRDDPRSPLGPADVGMVVEVVSPHSRRTDRYAKPGEYAEAGIGVFWRLETEPALALETYVLVDGRYVRSGLDGGAPVPWGQLPVDVPAWGQP